MGSMRLKDSKESKAFVKLLAYNKPHADAATGDPLLSEADVARSLNSRGFHKVIVYFNPLASDKLLQLLVYPCHASTSTIAGMRA